MTSVTESSPLPIDARGVAAGWRMQATIGAILAGAAALRLWNVDSGIPYAVGVDEPEIAARAANMIKSGNFHPNFFDYPTLTMYLQVVIGVARFLAGALDGTFTSLQQFGSADIYLPGRVLSAMFGTGTVLLVYLAGRRWGEAPALIGAALMAVMPMHVRESHYLLTDVPLTFFTTAAFVASLRAVERPTTWRFAAAGACVGLAAGTKYNGAVALLLPLLAAVFAAQPTGTRVRLAAVAGAASGAAFLAAAPYTVLALPQFLNAFAELNALYNRRVPSRDPGWLIYLKHLRNAFWWVTLGLAMSGLAAALLRVVVGPLRSRWALAVVFPLVYFHMVASKYLIFGRYVLPAVPFLCVLAAIAAAWIGTQIRVSALPRSVQRAGAVLLLGAMLLPPLQTSVAFNRNLGRPTTQAEAWRWLEEVPPSARLVVEGGSLRMPPERWGAVRAVSSLAERTPEQWAAAGFDWAIASSDVYGPAAQDPAKAAAYDALFQRAPALRVITPSAERIGPELRILRLR